MRDGASSKPRAEEQRTGTGEGNDEGPTPTVVEPRRHSASIAALCLCTLTHAYLLISVFPYAGYMAIHLKAGLDEENAGGFAGLISSAFMIGRAFSSYPWGKAADLLGRKTVLRASLASSAMATLLFGMAPTLSCALASRFLLGLSNGMPGTAKTLATELAGGDAALETRGMGLVFSMWGIGYLLGPAVGGLLAEPLTQYPDAMWAQSLEPLLSRFPFLLPNLVGVACCAISWAGVTYWIDETLPEEHRRDLKDVCQHLAGMRGHRCYGSNDANEGETTPLLFPGRTFQDDSHATISSLWRRKSTRRHLVAYWGYSFFIISLDEAFPLFCISKKGGLGVGESEIGKILSAAGFVFVSLQYVAFAAVTDRLGVHRSLKLGSLGSTLFAMAIPIAVPLNAEAHPGRVSTPSFFFSSATMAIILIFSMIFQSSITIATNGTVPAAHRATMNGLSMLGGSFSKGLGPAFAGLWVSFSLSSGIVDPKWGSMLIFGVLGGLGLAVSGYTFCVLGTVTADSRSNA